MAAEDKISGYPKITILPQDTDQFDFSQDDGVGGFVSTSVEYLHIKTGADLIAFADTVDAQTPAVTAMTYNCVGKKVRPKFLEIESISAAKGIDDVQIRLQKNGGVGDIVPLEPLSGFTASAIHNIFIIGSFPSLLSDSDFCNLEIVVGSSGLNTFDFKLYGSHEDVP